MPFFTAWCSLELHGLCKLHQLEVFMIKYLLDESEQRKLQKVFDIRLNHTIFLSLAKES